jgi:S1-C subfamily serine protease
MILTCRHILGGKLFVNGIPAQVVRIDTEHDLMLLKVPTGKIPQIRVASSYKQDDDIVYIGNPLGHRHLIGRGKIVDVENGLIFTDAHITFGASGSPVYDSKGHLVGLVTAIEGKTFGVIIPIDVIIHFLTGK